MPSYFFCSKKKDIVFISLIFITYSISFFYPSINIFLSATILLKLIIYTLYPIFNILGFSFFSIHSSLTSKPTNTAEKFLIISVMQFVSSTYS